LPSLAVFFAALLRRSRGATKVTIYGNAQIIRQLLFVIVACCFKVTRSNYRTVLLTEPAPLHNIA
jgi:hypothetical protein